MTRTIQMTTRVLLFAIYVAGWPADLCARPSVDEALRAALDATVSEAQAGRHLAIHCSAGIGRTGLFAACLAKRLLNLPGESAIEWVRRHIADAIETSQQRDFVSSIIV